MCATVHSLYCPQNVLPSTETKKHVLPMVTSYDMADMLQSGDAAKDKLQPDWFVFQYF